MGEAKRRKILREQAAATRPVARTYEHTVEVSEQDGVRFVDVQPASELEREELVLAGIWLFGEEPDQWVEVLREEGENLGLSDSPTHLRFRAKYSLSGTAPTLRGLPHDITTLAYSLDGLIWHDVSSAT